PCATALKRLSSHLVNDLSAAKCPTALARAQIGEDCFAANRGLACGNQWRCVLRQIDIETRTKADHAKALSSAHPLARADEADDAPCNKAGNPHDGNTRASSCDPHAIALLV